MRYVYQDGDYGSRRPVASIACNRATRFKSTNYQNFKVPLGGGWVAFRSPAGAVSQVLPPDEEDEPADDTLEPSFLQSDVAEVLDLLSSERYVPDEDPWLPQAKLLVERSIDQLIQEFIDFPYLHRVEHSIHCQLFHILLAHEELAQRVSLGTDLGITQLVHKEWPESIARGGNRRGNFDLAVLSPQQLKGCTTIGTFRGGHLHAPIVIEMGLDYDAEHLARDVKKLINSKPKYGYLVHLVREQPREPVAEQIMLGIEAKYAIKTAYVWKEGEQTVFKRVNDQAIAESRSMVEERGNPVSCSP